MAYNRSTVADLIRHGRKIRWECDVIPAHWGPVDLQAILHARGPDVLMSNRRPPCRVDGCLGRVRFRDCTSIWPISIDTIDDPEATWAYSDARDARLRAEGWTMEMGKWVPPESKKPASG